MVYQATFFDGRWGGQADFLLRTDQPSDLGGWSYDIADTKLARRLKVPALLQMATYAERLAVLQGVPPQLLTVVTGDGVERPWRLDDVASYARRPGPACSGGRDRRRHRPGSGAALLAVPLVRALHHRWEQATTSRSSPACARGPAALIAAGSRHRDAGGAAAVSRGGPRDRPTVPRAARPAGAPAGERARPPARPPTSCCHPSPTAGCCGCRRRATATSTSTSRATRSPPTGRAGSTSPGSGTAADVQRLVGARPRRGGALTSDLLDELTRRWRPTRACTSTTTRPTSRPPSSG